MRSSALVLEGEGVPNGLSSATKTCPTEIRRNRGGDLGRGCDEALLSQKKGFSVKRGEAIQWMGGLVRISTGKAIQWRGSGHSLNRRTLRTEKLLSSSPSRKSAPTGMRRKPQMGTKAGPMFQQAFSLSDCFFFKIRALRVGAVGISKRRGLAVALLEAIEQLRGDSHDDAKAEITQQDEVVKEGLKPRASLRENWTEPNSQFFGIFSLIFAFPANSLQHLGSADSRRKPAGNCRKPQIFAETGLPHLVCPFWFCLESVTRKKAF